MRQVLVIALIASMAPGLATAAEIYRWTDETGNTHYSENPPQGVDAQPMNIQTRTPEPANRDEPSSGGRVGTTEKGQSADRSGNGSQQDSAAKAPNSEAVAEARRENCEAAREALKMLRENARVQVEENGERRYLSPEEMEEE